MTTTITQLLTADLAESAAVAIERLAAECRKCHTTAYLVDDSFSRCTYVFHCDGNDEYTLMTILLTYNPRKGSIVSNVKRLHALSKSLSRNIAEASIRTARIGIALIAYGMPDKDLKLWVAGNTDASVFPQEPECKPTTAELTAMFRAIPT